MPAALDTAGRKACIRPPLPGSRAPGGARPATPGRAYSLAQTQADDPGEISASLRLGLRLVASVESFCASLAFDELGDIDLPPAAGSATDQANLRAIAPIYLASELESARLLPVVETLAGVFFSGGLQSDLGPDAQALQNFWRQRHDRLSPEERHAFFARIFGNPDGASLAQGDGANLAFEDMMITLTEALLRCEEDGLAGQARVRAAAAALAGNLLPRSSGMTAFAARDILETTQAAVDILKRPAVQRAVGANSLWLAVRLMAQRYLSETPPIAEHVTRGKAGLLVIGWLAEVLPLLDGFQSRALVSANDTVISAATAWLETSLELHESASRNAQ